MFEESLGLISSFAIQAIIIIVMNDISSTMEAKGLHFWEKRIRLRICFIKDNLLTTTTTETKPWLCCSSHKSTM